jgi:hypothetical protein
VSGPKFSNTFSESSSMRWSRSVSSRMCAQPSRMLSPYLYAKHEESF